MCASRGNKPPLHFEPMTNTELTLDQLYAISGGNCADNDKDKGKNVITVCDEAEDCPNNDWDAKARGSKLKKSSKPIPYTESPADLRDQWAHES